MRIRSGVSVVVLAVVVAACGGPTGPGPSWVPGPTIAPSGAPASPSAMPSAEPSSSGPGGVLPLPDGTESAGVLIENADGRFDRYRSIGRLSIGTNCTATLIDPVGSAGAGAPPSTAPAYVLAAGHCLGFLDPNEVIRDSPPGVAGTVAFDWFVDAVDADQPVFDVASVAWATMKGTDVSLLELSVPLAEVVAAGLEPFRLASTAPRDGATAINVGAPVSGVGATEPYLRAGTCLIGLADLVLRERQWTWFDGVRSYCPDIYGGSSGSPVLDPATGDIVGVVTTTTAGSEGSADCFLGRPCEVIDSTWRVQEATDYIMPAAAFADCFGSDGRLAIGDGCGLDPGGGAQVSGAPLTVNPTNAGPQGQPPRTTWATEIGGSDVVSYRTKTGPLGTTDCRVEDGYGEPLLVADTPVVDDPLPTEEGQYVLCVVGSDAGAGSGSGSGAAAVPLQAFGHATVAAVLIDTTPASFPPEVAVLERGPGEWTVEPIFAVPDYSDFWLRVGPATTTDCSTFPEGFVPYRRFPIAVPPEDLPAIACIQGFDDADNRAEVLALDVPPAG